MKLYILSSLVSDFFKNELSKIPNAEIEYITKPQKLSSLKEIQSNLEKVLVIDPDFVDWEITNADFENIDNLKAVLVSSTSYSWVEQDTLKSKNIPLINVKDWCTQAVAEWSIMMALDLSRKIPLLLKEGFPLDYDKFIGTQLAGKTAGVVGVGNIGKALCKKLEGLGMNVVYWSRESKSTIGKYVSLEELFKNSDYIFPTMSDNAEVKKLITDELVNTMKKTSYFISIVHKYYNHELLIQKVSKGEIAGYGFEDSSSKMTDFEGNIWVVPEYAWCTTDSYINNDTKLLENIKKALAGDFSNKVN